MPEKPVTINLVSIVDIKFIADVLNVCGEWAKRAEVDKPLLYDRIRERLDADGLRLVALLADIREP